MSYLPAQAKGEASHLQVNPGEGRQRTGLLNSVRGGEPCDSGQPCGKALGAANQDDFTGWRRGSMTHWDLGKCKRRCDDSSNRKPGQTRGRTLGQSD